MSRILKLAIVNKQSDPKSIKIVRDREVKRREYVNVDPFFYDAFDEHSRQYDHVLHSLNRFVRFANPMIHVALCESLPNQSPRLGRRLKLRSRCSCRLRS